MAATQTTGQVRRPRTRRTFPVTVTHVAPRPTATLTNPVSRWAAIHEPLPQAVGNRD